MNDCCTPEETSPTGTTRRTFLQLAALGGIATLLGSMLPASDALAGGRQKRCC